MRLLFSRAAPAARTAQLARRSFARDADPRRQESSSAGVGATYPMPRALIAWNAIADA
jgi:hypothetical protein